MRNLMLTFFFALAATSVTAQTETATPPASQPETPAESPYRFLVGPFLGLRTGGTFTALEEAVSLSVNPSLGFGLIFDYKVTRTSKVEFIWSRQSTDFDATSIAPVPEGEDPPIIDVSQFGVGINYFHGAYVYGGGPPRFQPYVALGAGVSTFSPDGVEDTSMRTKFSFSLGTGFRSFVTERIGILVDARAFGTRAGDQREDIACTVFGCVSFETAATFWQGQVVGGVVFAF